MAKLPTASKPAELDVELGRELIDALVRAGATERSAAVYVELRGLGGGDPKTLRGVGRDLSGERVRQLVTELEATHLRFVLADKEGLLDLRGRVQEAAAAIEDWAPRSDAAIALRMTEAGTPLKSAASIVRLADTLGCHHGLRLTSWTSRAKFVDAERSVLAAYEDGPRRMSVTGVVPCQMPELFESFINFARKFSRGAGVMAAGLVADRYSQERGIPVTQSEAVALLEPFAVHLGRHEGEDWFAFFNSANDFLRKASTRMALFGQCSFEALCRYHERYNRSLYADDDSKIPQAVLHSMLELAGYEFNGDILSPSKGRGAITAGAGRGVSETQALMVKIFRRTLTDIKGRKAVPRAKLVAAMIKAGIRESTAYAYLGTQGVFQCRKGLCRLVDGAEDSVIALSEGSGQVAATA